MSASKRAFTVIESLEVVALAQAVLVVCAVIMGYRLGMPLAGQVGLGLMGCCVLAAEIRRGPRQVRKRALAAAWLFSALAAGFLLLARPQFIPLGSEHAVAAWLVYAEGVPDYYIRGSEHAVVAWLVAAAILPAAWRAAKAPTRAQWRLLPVSWAFLGAAIWLGVAYVSNERLAFHIGLAIGVGLILLCKVWFRMPFLGVQVANTLILMAAGLPVANLLVRPAYHQGLEPESQRKLYSYEAARKDPVAFAQWCEYFVAPWRKVELAIGTHDPDGVLPSRARARGPRRRSFTAVFPSTAKGFAARSWPQNREAFIESSR